MMALSIPSSGQCEVEGWACAQRRIVRNEVFALAADDRPDFRIAGFEDMMLDSAGIDYFRCFEQKLILEGRRP